jgi:hypothetical protein
VAYYRVRNCETGRMYHIEAASHVDAAAYVLRRVMGINPKAVVVRESGRDYHSGRFRAYYRSPGDYWLEDGPMVHVAAQ